MKYLLIPTLLLSGCALTDAENAHIASLYDVHVGDTYSDMRRIIKAEPYDINCIESATFSRCTYTYRVYGNSFVYYTLDDIKITSIYR